MKPEEIKQLRKDLKWNQTRLALFLGTTQVSVSRWENGLQKPMKVFMKQLAELSQNKELVSRYP